MFKYRTRHLNLAGSAEKLFSMCDEYGDNQRRKGQVWPLQNTLLILCPVRGGGRKGEGRGALGRGRGVGRGRGTRQERSGEGEGH